MAQRSKYPGIPGATGPDNGYGPTITAEDVARNPTLAKKIREAGERGLSRIKDRAEEIDPVKRAEIEAQLADLRDDLEADDTR